MSADAALAEALLRIEHKLDILIRSLNLPREEIFPLHFTVGQSCPVCMLPVEHVVDIVDQVAVRRCGCKTGKIPPAIPLIPEEKTKEKSSGNSRDVSELIADAIERTKERNSGQDS